MKPIQLHPLSALFGAVVVVASSVLLSMQLVGGNMIPRSFTPEELEILGHMSIVYLDDGQGGLNKTIRMSGVNLQLVNRKDATDTANGVGNLIVGYNELRGSSDVRTGSHNVVIGSLNGYSSHGGIVAGHENSIAGAYASVVGGQLNRAIADYASVSGGQANEAANVGASVSGGILNLASGFGSAVSGGGGNNIASGFEASVCGGTSNTASGFQASICGGKSNVASGAQATVTGGRNNEASGARSTVGGGQLNKARHDDSTVSGGCANETGADCEHGA